MLAWSVPWLPALGIDFGFRMDGLAWLFTLLIGGIGALVVLYAAFYLDPKDPARRFYVFLLLFMGAMLGVVLADNLLLLVVFWELTSLSSFLLIGYWHRRDEAREGARMALAVTGAGGLCLLAGVLAIGHIVGSFKLDAVLAAGDVIRAHPLYVTALVLVLLGAFTKSAQVPFHFWLPHAMAAPTPVSAYLHSATMVKAGVFLLARLYPALGNSEPWFWIVSSVGLVTLVLGAYIAIFKHDLKGLLAYSTISHLGLITLLFGLDEPLAVVAGVFHIINHATFKAGLFMSAGIIDHETGTRDMRRINGLFKAMPYTATLGMVAAASMAGVPLMNGFLSKEMFFAETVAVESHALMNWLLPAGATLAGIFSVAYSMRFVHDVFFNGEPVNLPKTPHEAPFFMRLPVLLLVLLCIAVGLLPARNRRPGAGGGRTGRAARRARRAAARVLAGRLARPEPAAADERGGRRRRHAAVLRLAALHQFAPPGRSAAAVEARRARCVRAAAASGPGQRARNHRGAAIGQPAALPGAAGADGAGCRRVAVPARGRVAIGGERAACRRHHGGRRGRCRDRHRRRARCRRAAPPPHDGAAAARGHRPRRLPGLRAFFGAGSGADAVAGRDGDDDPDDARPGLAAGRERGRRRALAALAHLRDGAIALAAGLGTAALVWLVLGRPLDSIAPYFLSHTLPEGGGANAVNVIIVDFRGLDTLGEITVMGIAALTMQALLSGLAPRAGHGLPLLHGSSDPPPLMLQRVSQLVLPFALLISIYLFLRGHNLPGGGFIGGLVLALALMLQYVAQGSAWVDARTRTDPRAWIGAGLLIAAATGAASWWFGAPFLTSTYDYPWLPGVGGVPLASASVLDLGVYLVVTGATMVMLLSITRIGRSARAERWAAPEPARIPLGDRPTYPAGEGRT